MNKEVTMNGNELTTFLDNEQGISLVFLRYMIQEDCAKEDILSVLKYTQCVNLLSMYNDGDPDEIEKSIEYYKKEYNVVETIGKYLMKEPYNSGYELLEDESDDHARDISACVALFNGWTGCDAAMVHVHEQPNQA